MIDWRAALATAAAQFGLAVGGNAALTLPTFGQSDDFPSLGECFGRHCVPPAVRLVVFDVPVTPPELSGAWVSAPPLGRCPAAAAYDAPPRLVARIAAPPIGASWSVCLLVDAAGRVSRVGHIDDVPPIDRSDARRFAITLRFVPAIVAGKAIPSWIRLQVRADPPPAPTIGG